ncbi:MAG: hypothetical protein IT308_12285 [Anaerolineaceae bacterium]|nr:hypothetical protein [Anaerolineaceae bacterium]
MNLHRFNIRFEIILILLVLISHGYAAFSPANSLVNWYTTDDAYYYFKVAQNISEGHGVTFDQIGRTNGFHPLWMLICIPIFALARFNLILPLRLVILVLALFNAGAGVILYRWLKRILSPQVAGLAAIFWVFFPKIHGVTTTLGMESGVNAFFTILLLSQFTKLNADPQPTSRYMRELLWTGVIAAFVLFSRLDNIFLVLILGIWFLFPSRYVRFLTMGDLVLVVISVFLAFAVRLGIDLYYFYADAAVVMFAAALVVKPLTYYAFGLYQPLETRFGFRTALRVVAAVTIAGVLTAIAMTLMGSLEIFPRLSRLTLLLDWMISLPLVLGWHWLGWRLFPRKPAGEPVTPLETFSIVAWRRWLPLALRYFGIPLLTLTAYMLWSYLYFGTVSPVSGQIKRWWGTMYTVYGKLATSFGDILGITSDPDLSPWSLLALPPFAPFDWLAEYSTITERVYWGGAILLGLIYAGLIVFLLSRGNRIARMALDKFALAPVFVGCFLQAANYKMSGYISLHTWYWIAEMVFTVVLWAVLLEIVCDQLRKIKVSAAALRGGIVVLGALLIFNFWVYLSKLTPWSVPPGQEQGYLAGAHGLEENTESGSRIGSTGGGVLAYFTKDRTIINMDGLISSYPYYLMLRSGQGAAYLDSIGLNYVYGGEYVIKYSEPYVDMFAGRLKYLKSIAGSALFRYLPPAP